jgi:acyl-CoA reductase-like NAD-dependent aldehyde dehydrogenase
MSITATFSSHNPATGEVLSNYPSTSREEVFAAVDRAKIAAQQWQSLTPKARKKELFTADSTSRSYCRPRERRDGKAHQ